MNQLLTETPKLSQTVSRRRQGFHSLRSIVKILSAHHKGKPTVSIGDLTKAIHGGALQYYAPGKNLPACLGKDQSTHPLISLGREEVFWKDINRWLEQKHPTIKYRFPPPNTYREPDGADTSAILFDCLIFLKSAYYLPTGPLSKGKGLTDKTCEPLSLLVAGAGFEPATFGL